MLTLKESLTDLVRGDQGLVSRGAFALNVVNQVKHSLRVSSGPVIGQLRSHDYSAKINGRVTSGSIGQVASHDWSAQVSCIRLALVTRSVTPGHMIDQLRLGVTCLLSSREMRQLRSHGGSTEIRL